MRSRTLDVVRGVAALVALVVLVLGVPALLVTAVGWPLPTTLPSLAELEGALTSTGVADRTIVKALAVVVWVAWVQIAVALAGEVVAVVRGRPSSAPVPGMWRRLAATLVASVGLLGSSLLLPRPVVPSLSSLAAASALPARPSAAHRAQVAVVPERPDEATRAEAMVSAPERTWTVRRRDTLWGIAEQVLGSGTRWHELHAANLGREVAPGTVYGDDTEVLRAGWVLRLPGQVAVPDSGRVVVQPGDSLSRIAERVFGDAGEWPALWDANRGRIFGERRFDDPNLILVGWDLVVPTTGGGPGAARPASGTAASRTMATPLMAASAPFGGDPAPSSPDPAGGSGSRATAPPAEEPAEVGVTSAVPGDAGLTGDAAPGGDVPVVADEPSLAVSPDPASVPPAGGGAAPADEAPRPASSRPGWAVPTGLAGATLLATGLTGVLASKRQQRLRRVGPRDTVPAMVPGLAPVDAAVRRAADLGTVARLDAVLRALAGSLARAGAIARPLAVLQHHTGEVEVVLDGRAELAPPWERAGERWLMPASTPIGDLARAGAGLPPPCPALVQVGTTADAAVYVDLEAIGLLAVAGPEGAGSAVARAVALTLRTAPLGVAVEVVTSGIDPAAPGESPAVIDLDHPDAALDLAAASTAGLRAAVDGAALGSTFSLRAAHPEEQWEPVVVLLGGPLDPATRRAAAELVGRGGLGVGIVTDDAVDAADWRLVVSEDGTAMLEPLGVVLQPCGLTDRDLAAVAALVADADAAPVPAPPSRPAEASPAWSILVRLLGAPDVVDREGRPASFDRSKSLELVAWLAVHRDRATRDAARTALWETEVRDATFANVVSDARRSLARLVPPPEGEEWIGRTYAAALPLHPLVRTDADVVQAALDRLRAQDSAATRAELRAALGVVRGQPFEGTAYLWPDAVAVPSSLMVLVTSAACELARRSLADGDVDTAFWATAQGLRVLPGHEELVCLRMEAHAHLGDLAGVKREYESYERVILADAWGDQTPAGKVVATRTRLLRQVPRHT